MSRDKYIYLVIFGMALVTYIPRVLPLLFFSQNDMHPEVERFVGYFPVSILTALVVKELFFVEGQMVFNLVANPNIIPAVVTLLVSIKYKSMGLSMVVGIVAYIIYGMMI